MRHEMLTQRAPFCIGRDGKKGHAESAFRDACRTSSGKTLYSSSNFWGLLTWHRSADGLVSSSFRWISSLTQLLAS